MKKASFLCAVVLAGCTSAPAVFNIVPQPVSVEAGSGTFTFDGQTALVFTGFDPSDATIPYITDFLAARFGQTTWAEGSDKALSFTVNAEADTALGDEGYRLEVTSDKVTVSANKPVGCVYALQTLYQLMPLTGEPSIAAVSIIDYPRFEWRGSHLDVSRHFFDLSYIKKHLDVMTLYKMNRFHWHLTDDHGWRIQIDKYPKLTEIGAWRVDRSNVPWTKGEPPKPGEKATYGGFYTKDQIREVVAYAATRGIEVIPEIEIPGHCSEILAAYPEFACDKYPYYVQIGPYWPPKAILCGGNDDVMRFLKDVMDEVVELFPSSYIHIGGDEALKGNWEKCPKCQKRIRDLKLGGVEQLQGWMISEIEKYLKTKERRIIGWDEILEGGVSSTATIMDWRGWKGDTMILMAAAQGSDVIMTPNEFCYFDYYQTDPDSAAQEAIGGYIPIEKVYAFEPIIPGLTAEAIKYVKGGQANLWAEFLYTPENVEYMLLPRLLAISEVLWSPRDVRNWKCFEARLAGQEQRLKALGYNYCEKIGRIKTEEAKK